MTYQELSQFSGTWGLGFLVVMFAVALVYALWPSNKDKFEKAAMMPLDDDVEKDT